jgi:hypothetical protein
MVTVFPPEMLPELGEIPEIAGGIENSSSHKEVETEPSVFRT